MDSDSDDDDKFSFISYGTPLVKDVSELEEVPKKKPVPIEHQIVKTDGKRRFHGAFTGGFSAGYFNSVDTKEGWAPTTFLSTRNSRADRKNQNPEDFMDAEDLGAFGIAPRAIHVQKEFEESEKEEESRKRPHSNLQKSSIPGMPPLKDFVVSTRDSIGVKLLKKMGWRPGQGIGPRVNYKEKKVLEPRKAEPEQVDPEVKVYGCSLPENFRTPDNSDSEDFELYDGLTFAPDDVVVKYFNNPKDNFNGIGFVGLSKNPILKKKVDNAALSVVDKGKKLTISGEAFGVGAFEYDDETIYNNDDMSQYDFELHSGIKDPKPQPKSWEKKLNISYIGKELEGFHISCKPLSAKKLYSPPFVPKEFLPVHKVSKPSGSIPEAPANKDSNNHQLTSLTRAATIGELDPKTSVFEFLKTEDKIRLQNIKQNKSNVQTVTKETVVKKDEKISSKVEMGKALHVQPIPVAPTIKKQPLGAFRPFSSCEEKQKRYELFLHFREKKNEKEFLKYLPLNFTEWERRREMEEFQKAADLFKPMADSMSSRFVSSTHSLEESRSDGNIVPPEGLSKPLIAVGVVREKIEWHPDPVLCKRFNIPNPYPDSKLIGVPKDTKKNKFSIFDFFTVPEKINALTNEIKDESVEVTIIEPKCELKEDAQKPKLASLFEGLDQMPIPTFTVPSMSDPQVEEVMVTSDVEEEVEALSRPPLDLFKAIFADSDSDDPESFSVSASLSNQTSEQQSKTVSLTDILPKNMFTPSQTISSSDFKMERKAGGLFANLDLFKSPTPPSHKLESSKKLSSVAVKVSTECDYKSYGPTLPPASVSNLGSFSKDEQKHKQRKKKKKEKHHSKKHKHRRKSSNDDDSESEEEDRMQTKIMDKQIANKLRNFMKAKR